VACALQVLAWLGLWDADLYARLLPSVMLSGRMERVHFHGQEWIFDVAHNPAGAHFLANSLQQAGITAVTVIFSAMSDKDLVVFLLPCRPCAAMDFFPADGQCARGFNCAIAGSCNAAGVDQMSIFCSPDAAVQYKNFQIVKGCRQFWFVDLFYCSAVKSVLYEI
jgi:hypothetical protein